MAGAFCASFSVGIALASNQAYWQSKVPPDIQGKVFAMRRMIAQIAGPIGVLIAGPLADRVFEPATARSGGWSNWLVGSGPGAGMGLQMVIFGTAGALAGLCGYLFKATREAETLLPDHTQDYPVKKVSRT
jgi:MFS family permease